MKYITYVLECADNTLYVGYTTDVEKRLVAHNTLKTGAHYTKIRRPVTLVYSEKFNTLSEALKREHEIKSWSRQKKVDLIKKNTTQ